MRIGFVGAGNMAGAIIRGLISGGHRGSEMLVYDTDAAKMMNLFEDFGVCMSSSAVELSETAELLVLAVKPQILSAVLPPLRAVVRSRGIPVVYVAAGVLLETVEAGLDKDIPIIRVMPNLAAKVGESMSAFCANNAVSEEHLSAFHRVFGNVGDLIELPQSQFSAFTAIAGCSPAFTMLFTDAIAAAAVRCGMPKEVALRVACQTVLGTVRLMQESGEHPRALIDQVCSPAGTTIEGMAALTDRGFESAVHAAVKASYDKTNEFERMS